MTPEEAGKIVDVMASGSSHVRQMTDESLSQLAIEVAAIDLPAERVFLIVNEIVTNQRKGVTLPKAGDFIAKLRSVAANDRGRASTSRGDDPREWSEGTRQRLAELHDHAIGRGPIGGLRLLIEAGSINESRMNEIIGETERACGERVPYRKDNPFTKPRGNTPEELAADAERIDAERKKGWLKIDRPRAMQHINDLLFAAVRRAGGSPEQVIADWRKRNGYSVRRTTR